MRRENRQGLIVPALRGWVALASLCLLAGTATIANAATDALTDPLRGSTPILDESQPPPLQNQENKDVRRVRSHPMQPPTIPHKIDGYQLDKSVNRCLFCHARTRIEETKVNHERTQVPLLFTLLAEKITWK